MATLLSQGRRGLAFGLALAAALGCNSLVYAQVLYGTLVGNVTDVSQASVPRALVKLVNTETGQIRQAASDERGFFAFRDLQQGTYDLTVTASGFSAYGAKDISVSNNSVVRKDVNLQVGGTAESIAVSASGAGALQTDKADLHADLTSKHVTGLPLSGQRNYQSLLRLVPGVTPPQSANSEAGNPARSLVMNVNGTSNATNNTRIDGAGNNHIWLPAHAAYIPPAEANETVNVVTNSYGAEQGLAGGAVINVNFKSGTNEFHGSVYEYHTNSRMHARNFFYQGAKLPKTLLNQYGFTLGGPVVKNRLFFDNTSARARITGASGATGTSVGDASGARVMRLDLRIDF